MTLDPDLLRRSDVSTPPTDCVPVVLADSQAWLIAKPWLEVRAVFSNRVAAGTSQRLTYGAEIDALIEAIGECDDDDARLCAVASLAAALLLECYVLTDVELDELLAIRYGDPSSMAWTLQVLEVATGRLGTRTGRIEP